MKKTIFAFLLLSSISAAKADYCPIPDSAIDPQISVQITKENELYVYNYTVTNPTSGKLAIPLISLETNEKPDVIISPKGWRAAEQDPQGKLRIGWADYSGMLLGPGKKINGFIIKSKNAPGIVRFRAKGINANPVIKNRFAMKDKKTICPGIWSQGSSGSKDSYVSLMTEGPVPSSIITKKIHIESDSTLSPTNTDLIEIKIESDKEFNFASLDLNSLTIGRGDASVKSSEVKGKDLSLKFDMKEVNFLCDLDSAIFLSGKTKDGRTFFGATSVKKVPCTPSTFQKEVVKIRASDTNYYNSKN